MKIGDRVTTRYVDTYPGENGNVVDVTGSSDGGPVLHISFGDSSLAYAFPRWELEYANDDA